MNRDTIRNLLSGFIAGSFMSAVAALYVFPIPATNKDLIVFMLGQTAGFMGAVMAFHFGTSKGSADKTQMLAGMQPGAPADPVDIELPTPKFGGNP